MGSELSGRHSQNEGMSETQSDQHDLVTSRGQVDMEQIWHLGQKLMIYNNVQ